MNRLMMSDKISFLCCLIVAFFTRILYGFMNRLMMFDKISFLCCLIVAFFTMILNAFMSRLFMFNKRTSMACFPSYFLTEELRNSCSSQLSHGGSNGGRSVLANEEE